MVLGLLVWNAMAGRGKWHESYGFDHKNVEMHVFANKRVALPYSSVVQNRVKHDHNFLR